MRRWTCWAVILVLVGCSESEPPSLNQPLVVLGFDSADWTWMEPRMEAGSMPHFRALVERGARADLLSLQPRAKSPTIWTSISTGKRPAKHGVAGFIKHDEGVQRSAMRTATTYWEILGAVGKTQAVVGWWVTYPATPVNGVLVSDYIQYFSGDQEIAPDAVHPPEDRELVQRLVVDRDDLTLDDLARFIDVDIARAHGEEAERLLTDLRWIHAADETFRAVGKALYERDRPDVFTLYFRGVDAVSHAYWQYFQPSGALRVEPWQVEMLQGLIPAYYDYADELLGEVLGYVDPESRVLVCSDHGFNGLHKRGGGLARGIEMHDDEGILILAGPGVRRGATVEDAGVKDIAPTLLAMAGIPVAQDMDGHLLTAAFEPDVQAWFTAMLEHTVDTYEGIVPSPREVGEGTGEVDQEMLDRLRALGYID
ncbi:MAG: hypothetical protein HKO53_12380 [Gemmatimonadetes bacterium]|nr:hypothetical protein [Gemmatimonadota bacterium]